MASVKKGLFKKLPILLLLVALIFTFSFITGFTKPDSPAANNVRVPLLNAGAEEAAEEVAEEEEEEAGEETEEEAADEEVEKWICTCGFVYDPEETGINFEDLPDDWVCPECGAAKDAFSKEEVGEGGPYLAHWLHVIAMRMKHLAVFQRVLGAKDPGQHSVYAINHAIIQSSKSILKMQENISASLNGDTGDSNSTDTAKEEVENKGKGNKKDKSEKSNNGKAK